MRTRMDESTRVKEFPQLKGVTYLDHAGATLYSKRQLDAHVTDLTANLYGNPHSQSPSSQTSSAAVDHVRDSVLRFFGTDSTSYDVVFTSGCTGALRLLSESFPWNRTLCEDHTPSPPPLNPAKDHTPSPLPPTSMLKDPERLESHTHSPPTQTGPVPGCLKTTIDVVYTPRMKKLEIRSCSTTQCTTSPSGRYSNHQDLSNNEVNTNNLHDNIDQTTKATEYVTRDHDSRRLPSSIDTPTVSQARSIDDGTTGAEEERKRRRSIFCYLEDNHTSVIGMREVAAQFGALIVCATPEDIVSASGFECGTSISEIRSPQTESRAPNTGVRTNLSQSTITDHGCHTNTLESIVLNERSSDQINHPLNLFVYPAQSNFCGHKYPLNWCRDIRNGQLTISGVSSAFLLPSISSSSTPAPPNSWRVCLDAASFVGTNPLNLAKIPADFITLSFYKMFGFPTGLGALLVKKENSDLLHKRYYGGGTVLGTISRAGVHAPRQELHERLEDGTIPFLEIMAVERGFEALSHLTGSMSLVASHTFSLAKYVHDELSAMKHNNGTPVSIVYCHDDFTDLNTQGGIVNFNLLRPSGEFVGYSEVANLACVNDIHLRTGCFCNTGACMIYLHMDTSQVLSHMEAGHVCGDQIDLIDGRPTGSVRVSFGYMSTFDDAKKFIDFVSTNFLCSSHGPRHNDVTIMQCGSDLIGRKPDDVVVKDYDVVGEMKVTRRYEIEEEERERRMKRERHLVVGDEVSTSCSNGVNRVYTLDSIRLYPVKSCGAFEVSEWEIGGCGLRYDREWAVLSEHGGCLSQKQEPCLSLILPFLNLQSHTLELNYQGQESLKVPLSVRSGKEEGEGGEKEVFMSSGTACQLRICGDRVTGSDCGEEAAHWLTKGLGRNCCLVRQTQQRTTKSPKSGATTNEEDAPRLSLANEAQYLLISRVSVEHLLSEITEKYSKQLSMDSLPPIGEALYRVFTGCGTGFHPLISHTMVMSVDDLVSRFRPNLVVSGNGMEPYEEDEWSQVTIGGQKFKVTGKCSRCRTICVDQKNGEKSSEPLQTLFQLRGSRVGVVLKVCSLGLQSRNFEALLQWNPSIWTPPSVVGHLNIVSQFTTDQYLTPPEWKPYYNGPKLSIIERFHSLWE